MKRILQLVLWLCVLVPTVSVYSQTSTITYSLTTFLNSKGMEHASVSFCLTEAATGKIVLSHNPDQSLIPASTMKVVTTGAALGILGPDYRFKTSVGYSGEIKNDVLEGNIVIHGGGDPALGAERFSQHAGTWFADTVARLIASKNIRRVTKRIIISGNHFQDDRPITWAYNDLGNYYASPAFGFNFNENQYKLFLQPAKNGLVLVQQTIPPVVGTYRNRLAIGAPGSQDSAYISGASEAGYQDLYGTIPAGVEIFTIKGALPHPDSVAKDEIEKRLAKSGIIIEQPGPYFPVEGAFNLLGDIYSPPLIDIIHYTNLKSLNLYAECLLKEMAVHSGKIGNTPNGTAAVLDYWKSKGINTDGLFMCDGSGLSHFDAVSASQLCAILSFIKKQAYYKVFYNSLPVAGQSGAMSLVGKGTAIDGRLHAKTGHMDRVRSYAGYYQSKSGKWYSFALIVNNYTCSGTEIRGKISSLLSSFAQLP